MSPTSAPSTGHQVGSVVLLGSVQPGDLPIYGVVAARAPWAVRELVVVPADSMPVAGSHDLYLGRSLSDGTATDVRDGSNIWGLWLRGLCMVAMPEQAVANLQVVGTVAEEWLGPLGAFVRRVDLTHNDVDDAAWPESSFDIVDWAEKIADIIDPSAASPALRARIRKSSHSLPLMRLASPRQSTVTLAADAPKKPPRMIELKAADGRLVKVIRDVDIGRLLVIPEPLDDIERVDIGSVTLDVTAAGYLFRFGADTSWPQSLEVVSNNGNVYRGECSFD